MTLKPIRQRKADVIRLLQRTLRAVRQDAIDDGYIQVSVQPEYGWDESAEGGTTARTSFDVSACLDYNERWNGNPRFERGVPNYDDEKTPASRD